jgi:hypothetical protein
MTAANKQFCAIAAEVIIHTFVFPLTVSDNPKGSAVDPLLRKAAGTLSASGDLAMI